ncbi:nickel pincer cofactor biosynthesis protein LarC [Methanogenium organophilum]|uniref:LarC family nickel insertion protein n=1 Tax=Methanogenium organophilum TaxID=2199 RepID=A0A9X9T7X4_METOG|nr:LarC family nickel insertion protein [Methanogenium organophilum]WAI01554.1 LarC family nickel insertion protein [Methanogenium organophilum]
MRILHLECNMGASGDMLMSSLLELHPDPEGFIQRLNGLEIPGVTVQANSAVKCGIIGTQIVVTVNGAEEGSGDIFHEHNHEQNHEHNHAHEHHHHGMPEVGHIIGHLNIPTGVKNDARAVYSLIAEAESHVHGKPVDQVHFHEVGTMDAIADIVGVCLLMEELKPEQILASPVHVGSGNVRCAHGILPVPAPATAHILKDVPVYGGMIRGELCTPTGAALLKHFCSEFSPMPVMKVQKIGYGMGKKDFEIANSVRAFLGET